MFRWLILVTLVGCAAPVAPEPKVQTLEIVDAGPPPEVVWTREVADDGIVYRAALYSDDSVTTECDVPEVGVVRQYRFEPGTEDAVRFYCATGDGLRWWRFWIEEFPAFGRDLVFAHFPNVG